MATRPAFFIQNGKVTRKDYDFTWIAGLSASQKKKCALSLQQAIRDADPGAVVLDVSTRSNHPLGVRMSAFNLKLDGFRLENVFQSGKVFTDGGPFYDLLSVHPREAKHDPRLKTSGRLVSFRFRDADFPLEPITLYYDYIYIRAVRQTLSAEEMEELSQFTHFTDIEFNPNKSINTQAKAAAELKLMLQMYGEIPEMDQEQFVQFHKEFVIV